MKGLYLTSVTLHVLAALYWLGGMWFLALVAAPALRHHLEPEARGRMFREIGQRFRVHGQLAIGMLLITGVANVYFRGWLKPEVLGNSVFWASRMGHALAGKLLLVVVMLFLAGAHDHLIAPAVAADTPPERRERARRAANWMARLNAVAGIVIVYFAVRLARGGL